MRIKNESEFPVIQITGHRFVHEVVVVDGSFFYRI